MSYRNRHNGAHINGAIETGTGDPLDDALLSLLARERIELRLAQIVEQSEAKIAQEQAEMRRENQQRHQQQIAQGRDFVDALMMLVEEVRLLTSEVKTMRGAFLLAHTTAQAASSTPPPPVMPGIVVPPLLPPEVPEKTAQKKRTLTPEGRERIIAASKRYWAARRAKEQSESND